jgi:drug/metabolite transporter (DMT)-like permease
VKAAAPDAHRSDNFLAWFFVLVWGTGYIATKTGIQYAAPFTFLTLRFILGLALLLPYVLWVKPRWPGDGQEWFHICVAGLLMHGVNLGGSHYAQYLGMSAGIAALILPRSRCLPRCSPRERWESASATGSGWASWWGLPA